LYHCTYITTYVRYNYVDKNKGVPNSLNDLIDYADHIFLGIFTVEMILKVVAKGFFLSKGTYLRDKSNILDFIIVVMGYTEIMLSNTDIPDVKFLRCVRHSPTHDL
jgi:hypothetical protein